MNHEDRENQATDGRRVMDIDELAQYLKMGKRTIYRLVAEGEIPHARIGGALRFPSWRVDAWLDEQVDANLKVGSQSVPSDDAAKEDSQCAKMET